jgi:hypothetical protein
MLGVTPVSDVPFIRLCFGIAMPPICWIKAQTCAPFKCCRAPQRAFSVEIFVDLSLAERPGVLCRQTAFLLCLLVFSLANGIQTTAASRTRLRSCRVIRNSVGVVLSVGPPLRPPTDFR